MGEIRGTIFDIQRFSLHDGPGLRTTVFFKGCPLRCWWCHNPESLDRRPVLGFTASRCIACGACVEACAMGVHRLSNGAHAMERRLCRICGRCAAACPARALEILGRKVSVRNVMRILERDLPFYEASGGGVTLSGGEPLAQPQFAAALLRACRRAGIATALDTCGYAPWAEIERLLPLVDLWLYDLKHTDPAAHKRATGVSNRRMMANLRRLAASGARIWLRVPLVPRFNDSQGHLEALAQLAAAMGPIERLHLLPYHRLGVGKRKRVGLDGSAEVPPPAPSAMRRAARRLRRAGVPIHIGG